MNYIVLDLEWNQCPYGKSREEERLPFEIVEIGAVKMNEQKEIIDTFHILVKPIVYRRLHYRSSTEDCTTGHRKSSRSRWRTFR